MALAAVATIGIRHVPKVAKERLHQACAQAEGGTILVMPDTSPVLAASGLRQSTLRGNGSGSRYRGSRDLC